MAIKDHIKVSYVFENQKGLITRSNNSFQIIIQTQVDMDFEYASCILKYQISGKTYKNSNEIATIILDKDNSWKKNENYTYDASLQLGDLPSSYNGLNSQIIWWLYLEVDFNQESQSRIRNSLLKDASLVNLVKSFDGRHVNKNLITLSDIHRKYSITSFSLTHNITPYLHLLIGGFLLMLSLIFLPAQIIRKYIWLPTLIGLGFSSYGIYQIVGIGILDEVHFNGTPVNDEHFELEITIKKNHQKIALAIISYVIIEEVTDNRGTTSIIHEKVVYESKETTIEGFPSKSRKIKLNYPKTNIPMDFRKGIRFYAQIKLKLEFINKTKGLIKQEFPLTRTL